ncbi:MAG: large subunit ribosomal protein L9 [Patiriisocius sp.]|jgi:large subunit ribosomal protein L9
MKVILLQDVAKIGRRFDIVEVPSGYGLNKLIPQGMAKQASPENIKAINAQSAKTEADRAAIDATFTEALAAIKETALEIAVEANEEGRMFQALKTDEILAAIKTATGKELLTSQLVIKTPIKEVGEHTLEFVSGEIQTSAKVSVVAK